ncbi:MAG: PD-(D/E)XK nuclease family protein [Bacteroidia bacterium]|nr:PD-(D/E)XK nuclease family protein [Bacteroidia bacterium]
MLLDKQDISEEKEIDTCPYCSGKNIIKKGIREKKHEDVQLYFCNDCNKKFTPGITKNKTYPLHLMLDAVTLYNRLNTLEDSASKVSEKYGIAVSKQNIANWLNDFDKYLSFGRMREYVEKNYDKRNLFVESQLAVANNKLRHEILQEFMLMNDSVTIATEVPVLLDKDDLLHYKNSLNFHVPITLEDEEIITGHIDIVQIRNGMIHILDYKPSAKKEKPIDQLTIYALALSRLTSLRLYHFKCAWFDEDDYYEFYPLHVVFKINKKTKNKNLKQQAVAVANCGSLISTAVACP